MTQFNYPFKLDGSGRTATASGDDHIRQLVEQVLFTVLGERVNRPTFGSGVGQLVFAPNSSELASATQFLVQGALQQWLKDLIHVESVTAKSFESTLTVAVHYLVKGSQERRTVEFAKEV
ncbi:MAG: GPW/gp25 family protein [Nitrososphaera sp.]|jgi:hypothetical protein